MSPVRVAYSGEPGAFAEDAMLAAFDDPAPVPVPGFREVFEAVTVGCVPGDPPDAVRAAPVAAGVVPIENLVNGTVRENYDLLLEHDLAVSGEVVVPVRLCLAALPGQALDEIDRVYSHIQALGQAERFLRTRPWTLLTTYNTAGAAKMIVDRGERAAAAVLSPRAAAVFGLEILADDIQQVPDNRTRFLVVTRPDNAGMPGGRVDPAAGQAVPMRTTMVLAVRNEPGSLYRCLGVFARAGLNMSKLESRPSRDRAWEYVFWVDLDADAAEARAAADALRPETAMLRILGTYPRSAAG
jgi:prephenate dehydratase